MQSTSQYFHNKPVNAYSFQPKRTGYRDALQLFCIGFPDKLFDNWIKYAEEDDSKWIVQGIKDPTSLFATNRMIPYVDLVLLYLNKEELADISFRLLKIRKKIPYATIIVVSNSCDAQSIQGAFLFGASGFILDSEPVSKTVGRFPALFNKQFPAVSEKLIPYLVDALKGPTPNPGIKQPLTEFQLTVARLLVKGMSYEEIAQTLGKNLDAVRYHIKKIYQKYNISRRMQLIPMLQADIL